MLKIPWVIYTCKKYLYRAEQLYGILRNSDELGKCEIWIAYGDRLISSCPNSQSSSSPTIFPHARKKDGKYLLLQCHDGYESPCSKTKCLLDSGFFDTSGFVKCDDDIVPHIPALREWLISLSPPSHNNNIS